MLTASTFYNQDLKHDTSSRNMHKVSCIKFCCNFKQVLAQSAAEQSHILLGARN